MAGMRRVLIPTDIDKPPGPAAAADVFTLTGTTMGTTWSVKVVSAEHLPERPLRAGIEAVLDGVIAQMSPWLPDTDISRFNRAEPNTWHQLPNDFATVLDCAMMIARESDGAYDPTAGALVDLWGFGSEGPRASLPSADEIAAAQKVSGWRQLQRDGIAKIRQPGGLRLDLSSIAKGFAVDRTAKTLDHLGLSDYLVEIGGELKGQGVKPDGSPWWVALDESFVPQDEGHPPTIIALHGLSVATSGNSEKFVDHGGRRLGHVLDPRVGHPLDNDVAAVTVLHRQCMHADAWATALMVMGAEQGLATAERNKLAVRFVTYDGHGHRERLTSAMTAMLE